MPRIYQRKSLAERFWPKVDVCGPNECWAWKAGRHKKGYGKFVRAGRPAVTLQAHRVSWELHNGPIPSGLFVCHHCDNPSCVNPAHLFLGTHQDNMTDRNRKGRATRGEMHPRANLTAKMVAAIKNATGSQRVVAAQFGIGQTQVWRIRTGAIWSNMEGG